MCCLFQPMFPSAVVVVAQDGRLKMCDALESMGHAFYQVQSCYYVPMIL